MKGEKAKGFFEKVKTDTIAFRDLILKQLENGTASQDIIKFLSRRYRKGFVADLPGIFFEGSAQTMINILINEQGID